LAKAKLTVSKKTSSDKPSARLSKTSPSSAQSVLVPVSSVFPFSGIVGQEEMKLSLLLTAIDPSIGGVLVFGDRGTGKSTAIRGLAALLPALTARAGCPYRCSPTSPLSQCPHCGALKKAPLTVSINVPVVDLPLGATEDRVVGALDLEKALAAGIRAFEPGLLAAANRGFLYIDEVNLLDDHLVDLLIDVAASGENVVERDGLSIRHPARFVLIGSGNPEEGELRPQLLDRFGLSCEIKTPTDVPSRVEIVKRRDAFERDPQAYIKHWADANEQVRALILKAKNLLPTIKVSDEIHELCAKLCISLQTDGLRGELTLIRCARAYCAMKNETIVSPEHVKAIAAPALRHRLRRNPLDDAGSSVRIDRALAEFFH
jgi:magnesium chelatase subunit I